VNLYGVGVDEVLARRMNSSSSSRKTSVRSTLPLVASAMANARSSVSCRGELARIRPTAFAPASMAALASLSVVRPQILTRNGVSKSVTFHRCTDENARTVWAMSGAVTKASPTKTASKPASAARATSSAEPSPDSQTVTTEVGNEAMTRAALSRSTSKCGGCAD